MTETIEPCRHRLNSSSSQNFLDRARAADLIGGSKRIVTSGNRIIDSPSRSLVVGPVPWASPTREASWSVHNLNLVSGVEGVVEMLS